MRAAFRKPARASAGGGGFRRLRSDQARERLRPRAAAAGSRDWLRPGPRHLALGPPPGSGFRLWGGEAVGREEESPERPLEAERPGRLRERAGEGAGREEGAKRRL